jgi:hypothetical protein
MSPFAAVLILLAAAGQTESDTGSAQPVTVFQTGPRFQTEIDRLMSASWANVELRDLLKKIGDDRRVAILLDRRVDPTVQLPLNLTNSSLREGVRDMARLIGADISIAEPVVYVGPPAAAQRLRTLIELRSNELSSRESSIPEKRRVELAARHTVTWQDLDSSVEIVQRIADRYRLTIGHLDLLPHDLWVANTLPSVTAAEALSLVLIQFDLTFAWTGAGQGIELVSAPERPVIEKRHRVKGRTAAEALKLVQQYGPDLDAKVDGSDLVVRGLLEDHETVAAMTGGGSATKKPDVATGVKPIKQRLFTLKIDRVPVRVLMKKLEESEIVFEYDAELLATAGIDLDQPIKLEVEKAPAADFFKAVFDPLRLTVEIDNLTVKLKPKR